jgi:hypothetical protein
MFSSRILSFFFLFITLGLFVCAKPIDTAELAARSTSEIAARGGNKPQDIIDILVDLKAKVDVDVALLGKL